MHELSLHSIRDKIHNGTLATMAESENYSILEYIEYLVQALTSKMWKNGD